MERRCVNRSRWSGMFKECGELEANRVHHEQWLASYHEFKPGPEPELLQHGDYITILAWGEYGGPAWPDEVEVKRFRHTNEGETLFVDSRRYRRIDA